jgi:hypothetical protein
MVLRIPAVDGVFVPLMQQKPLFLARSVVPATHQHKTTAQLLAVDFGVQLSGRNSSSRVVGAVRFPGAAVPHDDVTSAVLPRRDHPLEIDILDGMVLDMDRDALHRGIESRALRDSPAHQHAIDFEAKVVVEPASPMPLHHEPPSAVAGSRRGHPGWLRGTGEVPLTPIRRELLGGSRRAAALPPRRAHHHLAARSLGSPLATPVPHFPRYPPEHARAPALQTERTGTVPLLVPAALDGGQLPPHAIRMLAC